MASDRSISERLDSLEARMAAIEESGARSPVAAVDDDTFWALSGLKERVDPPGAVVYAGAVVTAAGPVDWQVAYPTERLLAEDWSVFAAAIAALGHPTRLSILQAVLNGATTVAELAAGEGMGTSGQLYHHLHQLTAQGWLAAEGRGVYGVPPERVVPLLTVVAAGRR